MKSKAITFAMAVCVGLGAFLISNSSSTAQGAHPDSWRYRWHNNEWWYWTPNNNWVFWRENRWNPYDGRTYRPFVGGPGYGYSDQSYGYGTPYYSNYPYSGYYGRGSGYYGRGYRSGYGSWYGDNYGRYGGNRGWYGPNRGWYGGNYDAWRGANIGGAIGGAVGGGRGADIGAGIGAAIGGATR